jgi:enoyl-CoA hydratase/carnithine racemase
MGLDYKIEGQTAFFLINNPSKRNALDVDTLVQFQKALDSFNQDHKMRVGIIAGTGDTTFCSGLDLTNIPDPHSPSVLPPTLMREIETNKPLIAAINGSALGGGLELVLVCDIRISSSTAFFGLPEVKIGQIPGWGGTQRLIRQVAWSHACSLILSGQNIDAQEAYRIGLVNEVVAPSMLMSRARQWADLLSQAAPLAVQTAKEAMRKGIQMNLVEGLQLEDALRAYLKTTYDYQEGLEAFREKRSPVFRAE